MSSPLRHGASVSAGGDRADDAGTSMAYDPSLGVPRLRILAALQMPETGGAGAAQACASGRSGGQGAGGMGPAADAAAEVQTLVAHSLGDLRIDEAAALARPLLARLLAHPGRLAWALDGGLCEASGRPPLESGVLTGAGTAAVGRLDALAPKLGTELVDLTWLGGQMQGVASSAGNALPGQLAHTAALGLDRAAALIARGRPPCLAADANDTDARPQWLQAVARLDPLELYLRHLSRFVEDLEALHADLRRFAAGADGVTRTVHRKLEACRDALAVGAEELVQSITCCMQDDVLLASLDLSLR